MKCKYSFSFQKEKLPKLSEGDESLPEALLYLMLIGEIPSQEDALDLSRDLATRAHVVRYFTITELKSILSIPFYLVFRAHLEYWLRWLTTVFTECQSSAQHRIHLAGLKNKLRAKVLIVNNNIFIESRFLCRLFLIKTLVCNHYHTTCSKTSHNHPINYNSHTVIFVIFKNKNHKL